MLAFVPVPLWITVSSAYVTMSASFCRMTSLPGPPMTCLLSPSAVSTRSSGEARCRQPRAASVAYAVVMSNGVTDCVPSVIEHTGSSGVRIPIRPAMSTIASGVTAFATCAYTVLTEWVVADSKENVPDSESLAFETSHGSPSV
jgi:hypothetical protein